MSLLIPKLLLAEDSQKYKNFKDPDDRQERLDQDDPVVPGSYTIQIDDRVFSFTIPQERTAATYLRHDIDTQTYKERFFGPNNKRERSVVGLFSARRKDQTGTWPLVRKYGETAVGSGVFLKQDQTKSELFWADYRTLESLVKMTISSNYIYDAQGNRVGREDLPRDVVVINGRQWARQHYEKGDRARAVAGLPGETVDTYYTGLSADTYVRLMVLYPYLASSYPKDKERPEWIKQSSTFIAQTLSSIKISPPAGSTEPDFLTVDESLNTPLEMLAP